MQKKLVLAITKLFYRPQQSLQKGNVFTSVCHSVPGGDLADTLQADTPLPPGRHRPRQTHPLGRHPQADTLLGRHPPPPTRTATAVVSKHPTGMHTC